LAVAFRNNPGQKNAYKGCLVANNVEIGTSGGDIIDPAILMQSNAPAAASDFVAYTPFAAAKNDYHPAASSALRGAGANLSALSPQLAADRDGKPRPEKDPWDVGPYQRADAGPSPTPAGLALQAVSPTPTPGGPAASNGPAPSSAAVLASVATSSPSPSPTAGSPSPAPKPTASAAPDYSAWLNEFAAWLAKHPPHAR
jgi:hypothetical protein